MAAVHEAVEASSHLRGPRIQRMKRHIRGQRHNLKLAKHGVENLV